MILAGVVIFASAILPLTFNDERHSQKAMDVACMTVPWLSTIGFTTIFSALYSKTWRINRIFHNPNAFARVKVTERDVMKPYAIMMAMNMITLTCWTIIAPLTYNRFDHLGTDDWNRVISSYGICSSATEDRTVSNAFVPFLVIIVVLNFGLLILANGQAYQARTIQTEYSESKYIGIIFASILQVFALGIPCIFLLWVSISTNSPCCIIFGCLTLISRASSEPT
ncbi:hypothetical protein ACHAXR_003025 [Thalassiosira sp. AJA248-18]